MSESTLPDPEREAAERFRMYRLCPCGECNGRGNLDAVAAYAWAERVGKPIVRKIPPGHTMRCPDCRGEGRTLELVATATDAESVGVALITLGREGEWDECPVGIMDRPEGQTGKWIVKPWLPSARNVSDAGRTLARSKNTTRTG